MNNSHAQPHAKAGDRALPAAEIQRRMQELIRRDGPWTAHNICLADDVFTMSSGLLGREDRARCVTQTIEDLLPGPAEEKRVLDLGALEGQFAIELARRGAHVVAIEGRPKNAAKIEFARDVLGLSNLEVIRGDVRELRREKHGEFDVVLCCGILYHLDVPDCFQLIERVYEVCRRLAIIDTHFATQPTKPHSYKGATYHAWVYVEHQPTETPEQRAGKPWASLDNLKSAWLTRASLFNVLSRVGFSSVFEIINPVCALQKRDRVWLAALKGERVLPNTAPQLASEIPDRPEGGV